MRPHRRELIAGSAAALAFTGLARHAHAQSATEETYVNQVPGYGPLVRDPNRLLDLPEGVPDEQAADSNRSMTAAEAELPEARV